MKIGREYLVILILFIFFNVVAFVIPSKYAVIFWIAYSFSIISFAFLFYVWFSFFKSGKRNTSRYYKIPVLYVGTWYISIQFVLFLIFKFWATIPNWVAVLSCVLLLLIALVGLLSVDDASEYIEIIDKKVKEKVYFTKSLQVEAEMMIGKVGDEIAKKKVEELIEAIRFSDPMSDGSLVDIENSIRRKVSELDTLSDEELIEQIPIVLRLIEERNRKCKILK